MKELNSLLVSSRALFSWHDSSTPLTHKWVHPCVVGKVMCLFHAPNLAKLDPLYFKAIHSFAKNHNWQLRSCRRTSSNGKPQQQRKKWLPSVILAFSIGTLAASALDEASLAVSGDNHHPIEVSLRAMAEPQEASPQFPADLEATGNLNHELNPQLYDHTWHTKIKTVLLSHLDSNSRQHLGMVNDLDAIAGYYSQYPGVRSLISSLEKRRWSLQYAEKTYETQVKGSALRVDSINVLFDPRSAAQFKFYNACTEKIPFCVASPADVLLHELIHVKTITETPEKFIAQGGMNSVMYPFEHERKTIDEERRLYTSMTLLDGLPRPLRSEHTGRHVLAACVTCLQ